ncbi:hypothetical protein ACLOJK_019701 [Asimina triloba]
MCRGDAARCVAFLAVDDSGLLPTCPIAADYQWIVMCVGCPFDFNLGTLPGGFVQLGLGGASAAWDGDHLGMLLDGLGML